MKLTELLSSCQNQWKGLFGYNEKFEIQLIDPQEKTKKTYKWTKLKNSDNYLTNLRKREVAYWEMLNKDLIIIEIE